MLSTRVVLPWSTWAIIAMLRIDVILQLLSQKIFKYSKKRGNPEKRNPLFFLIHMGIYQIEIKLNFIVTDHAPWNQLKSHKKGYVKPSEIDCNLSLKSNTKNKNI